MLASGGHQVFGSPQVRSVTEHTEP
jgi:hypothetical protein